MELINNKYRVIHDLEHSEIMSSYLVRDMLDRNREKAATVADGDKIGDLASFYSGEYAVYKNLVSPFILRDYDIEPIKRIGSKRNSELQYCVLSEFLNNSETLYNAAETIPQDSVLNLFAEACCAVYYLHRKNIVYQDINFTNVLISRNKNGAYFLKLRDLATAWLYRKTMVGSEINGVYFKSPETLYENADALSDIYSLGVLLFCLVSRKEDMSKNFKADFSRLKESCRDEFVKKLIPVIEKAAADINVRYKNVIELLDGINAAFGTDYKAFSMSELEQLNLGAGLVGRDREIAVITENFDKTIAGTAEKRYTAVHGEHGIGKTALLMAVKDRLYIQNMNVLWAFGHEKDGALRAILKQIVENFDYAESDADFVRYILSVANGAAHEGTGYDKNSVIKFIYDSLKDKPVVFILDDIEKTDKFTVALLEKLIPVCKKLNVIFSYRSGFDNATLDSFLTRMREGGSVLDVELQPLPEADTAELIRRALSLSYAPVKLAGSMYASACGNPLFIEEILKNLKMKRILYARESDGVWDIDYAPSDYHKIPMPTSIEQAVKEQAGRLDSDCYSVLEAVSVFQGVPVNEMWLDSEDLSEKLKILTDKGILFAVTGKAAVSYGIVNKILKNYVYEKLGAEKARELHSLAADKLTGVENPDNGILDEIIIHLEKSGRYGQLFDYLLICGEKREKEMEAAKSAEYYKHALEVCRQYNLEDKEPDLLIRIADVLIDDNNFTAAFDYLMPAEQKAREDNNIEILSCAYILIAHCYEFMGELRKCDEYMNLAGEIFSKPDNRAAYAETYLKYLMLASGRLAATAGYSEEYREMAEHALTVCSGNHERYWYYKSLFTRNLAGYYQSSEGHNAALPYYLQSLEFAGKSGSRRTHDEATMAVGSCYRLMDNIEMRDVINRELDEKGRAISAVIWARINLAQAETHRDAYKGAERFSELLNLCIISGNLMQELDIALFLEQSYMDITEYDKAYNLLKLYENKLASMPPNLSSRVFFQEAVSMFYYQMGDFDKTIEHVEKGLKLIGNDKTFSYFQAIFTSRKEIAELFRLFRDRQVLSVELESRIAEAFPKILWSAITPKVYTAELIRMHEFYMLLRRHNCLSYLPDGFFQRLEMALGYKEHAPVYEAQLIYTKSLNAEGDEKRDMLLEAFEKALKHNRCLTLVDICNDLSDVYAVSSPYRSLEYAARACEFAQGLVLRTQERFRNMFIERHGLFSPFGKILAARNMEANGNVLDIILDKNLFADLQTDEAFKTAARGAYFADLPYGITDQYGVIDNLSADAGENLALFAKYFTAVTCAAKCFIVTDDPEEGFISIASNDGEPMPGGGYILKRAKTLACDIIADEDGNNISDDTGNLPENGAKAAMCVPLLSEDRIFGYVYLYSDSVFHNINAASLDEIKWFTRLLDMNVSLHTIKVSSMLDKLTGGLNRKFLEASLDYHIEKAKATGSVFSIIMIDLDKFKTINDVFGHQTGDLVIKMTGKVIRANFRKDTIFGRYGGEEFVVILDNTGAEDAFMVAEKLRIAIDAAKMLGSKRPVTGSMGIATYGVHDTTKAGLIEKADKALYICKANGRNRCEIYDPAYEISAKSTNTPKGVITGDTIKDAMRIRMTLDILELVKAEMLYEDRIKAFLVKSREIAEAETALCLLVENGFISHEYDNNGIGYNKEAVKSAVSDMKCKFTMDGTERSVMVLPFVNAENVTGVLYLSAISKKKAYSPGDAELARYLTDLAMIVLR